MAVTVSATELGNYAVRYPCMRCAWVRMHVKDLPYQSFPGIFSTIDSYSKKVVLSHFNVNDCLPLWLADLGKVEECVEPPSWRKFSSTDDMTGVTVRGTADAIFLLRDGSYGIADYKTSRYNPTRTTALAAYEIQLNAYAWIAERTGFQPVNSLALVFMEPEGDVPSDAESTPVGPKGFALTFNAKVVPVNRRPESLIPPLLEKVKSVSEMEFPPSPKRGCRDCGKLDTMIVKMATGLSHVS